MIVAVATPDFRKVAGHAGQARQWLVYHVEPGQAAVETARITLDKDQVFHHWRDTGPHPLDGIDAVLAQSAGEGFLKRLGKKGVDCRLTGETNAARAAADYAAGTLKPQRPPGMLAWVCKVRDLFSPHV